MNPTPTQIKRVVNCITSHSLQLLLRSFLNLRSEAELAAPLNQSQQLNIYLYEWLMHLGLYSDSDALRILAHMRPQLETWVFTEQRYDPLISLTISDRRYVAWTGSPSWYDIETDAMVAPGNSLDWVTFVGVHIGALYQQKQAWLKGLTHKDAPATKTQQLLDDIAAKLLD